MRETKSYKYDRLMDSCSTGKTGMLSTHVCEQAPSKYSRYSKIRKLIRRICDPFRGMNLDSLQWLQTEGCNVKGNKDVQIWLKVRFLSREVGFTDTVHSIVLFQAKQIFDFREQLLKTSVGCYAYMNMSKCKKRIRVG